MSKTEKVSPEAMEIKSENPTKDFNAKLIRFKTSARIGAGTHSYVENEKHQIVFDETIRFFRITERFSGAVTLVPAENVEYATVLNE